MQEAQGALLLDLLKLARLRYGWALRIYTSPRWTVQVFSGEFTLCEGR